ncbi:MAG: hypothetical protein ACREFF_07215 [Candidatus Udaeobacter sp.]
MKDQARVQRAAPTEREATLIETHSLPSSLSASPRGFAFCLADPIGSAAAEIYLPR